MFKLIEFSYKKFGRMKVMILPDENRILFSDKFLRKCLDVKNTKLPWASDIWGDDGCWVDFVEVFEYIRYARTDEETRNDFEEWISEVIMDCSKLL